MIFIVTVQPLGHEDIKTLHTLQNFGVLYQKQKQVYIIIIIIIIIITIIITIHHYFYFFNYYYKYGKASAMFKRALAGYQKLWV